MNKKISIEIPEVIISESEEYCNMEIIGDGNETE